MEELLREYFNACMDKDVDKIAETKRKLSEGLADLEEKVAVYENIMLRQRETIKEIYKVTEDIKRRMCL